MSMYNVYVLLDFNLSSDFLFFIITIQYSLLLGHALVKYYDV